MKIKERALAILLSAVMVLTFMPAMAFAEFAPTCTYDTGGRELTYSLVTNNRNFPQPGDTITVQFDEESAEKTYECQEFLGEDGETEYEFVSGSGEEKETLCYSFDWLGDVEEGENQFVLYVEDQTGAQMEKEVTVKGVYDVKSVELVQQKNKEVFEGVDDYTSEDEVRRFEVSPLFQAGDTLKVTMSDGSLITFNYEPEEWAFVGEDGLYASVYYEDNNIDWTQDWSAGNTCDVVCSVYGKEVTAKVDVKANPVASISFSPTTITLSADAIRSKDEQGRSFYDIQKRHTYTDDDETWGDFFAPGDTLTVNYTDGTSRTYVCSQYDRFVTSQGELLNDTSLYYSWSSLSLGNNKITVSYGDKRADISLIIEGAKPASNPAANQAAIDEAYRQGTKTKGLPKVKISKVKAAKKAATVTWKKLSKKELKKGVTRIEIWVCPNKGFGKADTKIVFAGKKKASAKIKGLKKGKYFVKVRAIKESGGVKNYTAWSKTKTVKIKK